MSLIVNESERAQKEEEGRGEGGGEARGLLIPIGVWLLFALHCFTCICDLHVLHCIALHWRAQYVVHCDLHVYVCVALRWYAIAGCVLRDGLSRSVKFSIVMTVCSSFGSSSSSPIGHHHGAAGAPLVAGVAAHQAGAGEAGLLESSPLVAGVVAIFGPKPKPPSQEKASCW